MADETREGFSRSELEFNGESTSQNINQAQPDAHTDGRLEDATGVEPEKVPQNIEDTIQSITGTNH